MSAEIKEILHKIENVVNHKEASYNSLIETKAEGYKQLLDYIISLQQKVEQLENIRKEAIEYLKKREYDNYSCSVCSVMSDDLLNILNKGSE